MNMVRAFEDAGAAAVQIEDQVLPKKCGHLNDKKLSAPHDMAAKIAAAARRAGISISWPAPSRRRRRPRCRHQPRKTLCRGRSRRDLSGSADDGETFRRFSAAIKVAAARQHDRVRAHAFPDGVGVRGVGYKMVIWPVSALRVANKAQAKLYGVLRRDGSTHALLADMQTRAELYDTIGLRDYEALDASIVGTVLPS